MIDLFARDGEGWKKFDEFRVIGGDLGENAMVVHQGQDDHLAEDAEVKTMQGSQAAFNLMDRPGGLKSMPDMRPWPRTSETKGQRCQAALIESSFERADNANESSDRGGGALGAWIVRAALLSRVGLAAKVQCRCAGSSFWIAADGHHSP